MLIVKNDAVSFYSPQAKDLVGEDSISGIGGVANINRSLAHQNLHPPEG